MENVYFKHVLRHGVQICMAELLQRKCVQENILIIDLFPSFLPSIISKVNLFPLVLSNLMIKPQALFYMCC